MTFATITNAVKGSALLSLASAFLARGATAALVFLLIALAGREMDVQSFGLFSMFYSMAGMLALIAAGGQQLLILRSWNEYSVAQDAAHMKGALIFGGAIFSAALLILSVGMFTALTFWHEPIIALAVTTYMAGFAVVIGTGHLVRAAIGIEAGDGLANFLMLIMPIIYLIVHLFMDRPASLSEIFFTFPVGALLAAIIHIHLLRKRIGALFPDFGSVKARFDLQIWRRRSLNLWVYNSLEAVNQFLDVLLLGLLMSPAAAGIYFVLTRLANTFIIAAGAVQFYASRHIPRLYYEKDTEQLEHYLKVVAIGCSVLVPFGLFMVWAVGPFVLNMLEPRYVEYSALLLLLSFGTASILASGASGVILTFIGHEGRILGITAATVIARLLGFIIFVPQFQILGAASVTSVSFILMSLAMWYSALKMTNLDGSVMRLFSIRRGISSVKTSSSRS